MQCQSPGALKPDNSSRNPSLVSICEVIPPSNPPSKAYVDEDGVAHNYVVKLVKYVREVFKAHGKEDLLVDLIEPRPQTPRASANEQVCCQPQVKI